MFAGSCKTSDERGGVLKCDYFDKKDAASEGVGKAGSTGAEIPSETVGKKGKYLESKAGGEDTA